MNIREPSFDSWMAGAAALARTARPGPSRHPYPMEQFILDVLAGPLQVGRRIDVDQLTDALSRHGLSVLEVHTQLRAWRTLDVRGMPTPAHLPAPTRERVLLAIIELRYGRILTPQGAQKAIEHYRTSHRTDVMGDFQMAHDILQGRLQVPVS